MSLILLNTNKYIHLLRLKLCRRPFLARSRIQSLPDVLHRPAWFTSLAHNYDKKTVSVSTVNSTYISNEDTSLQVEKLLREIDWTVRRTGRTSIRNVEKIFSLIEIFGHSSSTQSLHLLRCCGLIKDESPHRRVELATKIWKLLQNLGVKYDVNHFNSLLKIYIDCSHPFSPSEFLSSIEQHNIEPNKMTYLHLMEQYCKNGNLNAASEILEHWKEKEFTINEAVFCSLIKGHMKINDVLGAESMLQAMRGSNLSPSAESYIALACGYAEMGNMDEVKNIFLAAKQNNIVISNTDCLKIITTFATSQHSNHVDEILAMMENIHEWRQEFINAALDLVYKDADDVAFKLILASYNSENNNSTNIFIRQLINAQKPIGKIVYYCQDIQRRGLNDIILLNSAKCAIEYGMFDCAVSLFQEMQKLGFPVRAQYFFPLFSHGKNSPERLELTLKKMCELGIPADFLTYSEYIFPHANLMNPEDFLCKIQECGQSITGAVDPLFQHYCSLGEIENALYLIKKYPIRINNSFNLKLFMSFYEHSKKNTTRYFMVLRYILDHIGEYGNDGEALRGQYISMIIQTNLSLFENFCRQQESFSYSKRSLDVCRLILSKDSPQLLVHLRKLEHAPYNRMTSMTVEEEDMQLLFLKNKGLPIVGLLSELLSHHIQEKNVDRVYKLNSEIDFMKVELSPTLYTQLFVFFCDQNNFEVAENMFKMMKQKYPSFHMDSSKMLNYATLLIKYSKFDRAEEIIKQECKDLHMFSSKETVLRSIKKLLCAAVETGKIDLVNSIQNSLFHHSNYFGATNTFLESLIKIHLYRGDLEKAVEEFKNCVKNHKSTPCLNVLLKKCINAENHVKLETIIDMASTCSERHIVLSELALAFVEIGRKHQALKVIQNLGRKADMSSLEEICSRLYSQNKISEMEDFILVIRGLDYIDMDRLLLFLFKAYASRNDCKKVSNILKLLIEENSYKPSEEVQNILSKLFLRNKQKPPFSDSGKDINVSEDVHIGMPNDGYKKEFLDFVNSEDIIFALNTLQKMKKGQIRSLSFNEMTAFVDLAVQKKCGSDLSKNVQAMSYLIENAVQIIKPLLEKYSQAGDIEALNRSSNFLPEFTLRKISFNIYLSKAYINSNKHEDLLKELENRYDSNNKLFSIYSFQELLKIPSLTERVFNLAQKYTEVDFHIPIAVVWAQFLINGNLDKSRKIFQDYSIPVEKVDAMIFKEIKRTENIQVGKEYLVCLNDANVKQRIKERAYGTVLDLLVSKGLHDDAAKLLADAKKKNLSLENHPSTIGDS